MTPDAKNRHGFRSFFQFLTDSGQSPGEVRNLNDGNFVQIPGSKLKDEGD
jgi:hypothetical protein